MKQYWLNSHWLEVGSKYWECVCSGFEGLEEAHPTSWYSAHSSCVCCCAQSWGHLGIKLSTLEMRHGDRGAGGGGSLSSHLETKFLIPSSHRKGTFILFPKGRVSPSLIQITQFYGRARVFFVLTRGSCEIKSHSPPHSFLEQQKWNKGRLLAGLVLFRKEEAIHCPVTVCSGTLLGGCRTHNRSSLHSLSRNVLGVILPDPIRTGSWRTCSLLGLSHLSEPYPAWNRLRVWGLLWTFNAGLTL